MASCRIRTTRDDNHPEMNRQRELGSTGSGEDLLGLRVQIVGKLVE